MLNQDLLSQLDEVAKHEVAQRHSYFQLKYFVIGKEPTLQSKMWQCLRELKSRRDSLEAIDLEIDDTKDKLELLDISIEKMKIDQEFLHQSNSNDDMRPRCELAQREFVIKVRQAERQRKAVKSSLSQIADRKKWLEEEARFFLETFKNIQKIEPLKHFDDIESQKQYWSERLAQKLNLKMLTHNQLDMELIETIVALPDEMPIKQQTMGTLNLRHSNMVHQLKETMQRIESEKKEN